ncbi:MAG: L,D-transpeptidase [Alphaproteobacteria bacterium]
MRISPALIVVASLFGASASQGAVLIQIDKTTQQMDVSVDGVPRWTWPVSTGRSGYGTPSGSFRAFRMEEDHFSKEWDDAPMPHSIFFTDKGHAIHGSLETRRIGTPASHGCVRLSPANAAKLFALVKEQGVTNTKVVLTGSEVQFAKNHPQRATQTAARRAPNEDIDCRYYTNRDVYAGNDYYRQPQYQPQYRYQQPYGYQPPQDYYQQQYNLMAAQPLPVLFRLRLDTLSSPHRSACRKVAAHPNRVRARTARDQEIDERPNLRRQVAAVRVNRVDGAVLRHEFVKRETTSPRA